MEGLKVIKIAFLQIGFFGNDWGICLFDKYCYTTVFGLEKLNG